MKYKLLTLLTCFHALSPTASTCDMLTNHGEACGSAVLSSSVDTTPRHGLGAVTGIPAAIIADFLTRTPTNAAEACEIVRLIAEGKPFAER
jgi:hypothetical protein